MSSAHHRYQQRKAQLKQQKQDKHRSVTVLDKIIEGKVQPSNLSEGYWKDLKATIESYMENGGTE